MKFVTALMSLLTIYYNLILLNTFTHSPVALLKLHFILKLSFSTQGCLILYKMGCFTVLRSRKKRNMHVVNKKPITVTESTASRLPEPESSGPSLQSAPPSFRNRTKISQPANKMSNSRVRALSAPSSLIVDDQDALVTIEIDDQEENRGKGGGAVKEHRFSNPLPLPRPSQEDTSVLKNFGSFKSSNNFSGPIVTSGPLPLPPLGASGLRNFSYEEVSSACQLFSSDRCMSEGIMTTVYKATFGDDTVGSKKVEATVTRLLPSSQVLLLIFVV